MANVFDFKEMDKFTKDILAMANDQLPKESKKFLRKEGTALKRLVIKTAKTIVGKKTGNYMEGFKRGKAYKYKGSLAIRVYNSSPHAHLVENGHRQITKDGEETGYFVHGYHVVDKASKQFENKYFNDSEKFIEENISKLF
ncbi:HK97 gp10 family phage protein [Clostridium sp. YIM B02500]|uniref:HK97 gp10 family phage protein n=1 Tax=Clostridium sp. YIM B02500 TaxID=2910681 RepID=UPI001EED3713|nr:HK97 gp10 family phage protein [Clostridium sp. YIM B02500]